MIRRFSERWIAFFAVAACLMFAGHSAAEQKYSAKGLVLKVDRPHKTVVVSCETIPGFMDAMVMPLDIRNVKELNELQPGTTIAFTLVTDKNSSYASAIRVIRYQGSQPDPETARRLNLMNSIVNPDAGTAKTLAPGDNVPDFSLIDQEVNRVTLSQFKGKVVALNFVYTRCVLPNYCLRISNNFGALQKRFQNELGKDLVLLTVTFDPVHDRPDVLAKYSATWKADPRTWHFLTGETPDVKRVCSMFGVQAFQDEGLMNHSLHTAIIDRTGKLVANIEGNEYTARQLGDMVNAVLSRN